jgi:hypothetical protein
VQFYLLHRAGLVKVAQCVAALVRPLGIVCLVFAACLVAMAVAAWVNLGHVRALACIGLCAGGTYIVAVRNLFGDPLRALAEALPDGRARRLLGVVVPQPA